MTKKIIFTVSAAVIMLYISACSSPSPVSKAPEWEMAFSSDNFYINTNTPIENDGLRIVIPTIVFGADSADLDGRDKEMIANNEWLLMHIASAINSYGNCRVLVEGHANPTVDPSDTDGRLYEQTRELKPLSEDRAKNILNELIRLGVDSDRLEFYGIGGEHPVAAWEDRDNWWKNRRVEFILEKNI